ncbi:MAG: DUF4430 domain-containing protein [[Clostridium] spiroforme]|uniref:DUF4430 domain-containing protein n=1 Tax=Thomasclavelia spiroformis TaxID=29348 RepID=A0A943ENL1_9FIRM|nr:DUF4430 domain-containing protein [Thomasclavelia spiroformis]MBS5588303.1 DUF4430 domain-containing protein [Thomasclavelia spiroformis]
MFKNKKLVGLLICICFLCCSIFIITLASSNNLDNSKNIKETKIQQQESKKIFVLKQNEKENLQSQSNQETKSNQSNINQSSKVETNQGNNNISFDYIENTKCYITLSIDCKTILNNLSELPEQYHAFVPNNGAILTEKKVSINEGDTVFDVLVKVTKMQKIQVSSIGGYIQSINNLPEKLFNGSGGWMYEVNGVYGDKGSKEYVLKNNDKVKWRYSCYNGDLY